MPILLLINVNIKLKLKSVRKRAMLRRRNCALRTWDIDMLEYAAPHNYYMIKLFKGGEKELSCGLASIMLRLKFAIQNPSHIFLHISHQSEG